MLIHFNREDLHPWLASFTIVCRTLMLGTIMSYVVADEGPSKDTSAPDFRDELPRFEPVDPEDALATLDVKPPYKMELVAAEPLVRDPVAMAFDPSARLYVVQMRGYSEQRDEQLSSIRLLEDTTGDGRYDQSELFVDDLRWPTAIFCWDGGVFIADAPDIWFMKDTDGDGKVDVRRRVLTGFSHHNVQAMLNSFRWGLDNRIHCTVSTGGANIVTADESSVQASKPLALRTRDFAFDPKTMEFSATSIGGQHGMSFDDWGHKFVCTNSNHIMQVMYPDRYIARNPHFAAPASRILIAAEGSQADVYRNSPLEPWRVLRTRLRLEGELMQFRMEGGGRPAGYFTAATGVTIYRGDDWPQQDRGLGIVGDVGSNLIHRMRLVPNGLEFSARRIDKGSEMVVSSDTWFRPVQFANGPDGALYVADMYREIIEHPNSFGDVIKKHLHLTSGRDRGRIYRLRVATSSSRSRSESQPLLLADASTNELVTALQHPNAWHRETASRLLYERQDSKAVEPLKKQLRDSSSPLGRLHSMCTLSGLDALASDDILAGMEDAHPGVRRHAVRLAESIVNDSTELAERMSAMHSDSDRDVRLQLAFSLGELPQSPGRHAALLELAKRDGGNRWIRAAILSSLSAGASELFSSLVGDVDYLRTEPARQLLPEIARLVARQNRPDELESVVDSLADLDVEDQTLAVAIVRGLGQGIGRRRSTIDKIISSQSPGARRIEAILAKSASVAKDSKAPVPQRVDAVRLLEMSNLAEIRPTLASLLDQSQPTEVSQEALSVLDRLLDPNFAELVVNVWPSFGPKLRATAIELMVLRPERAPMLLDAIENGQINRGDLGERQIQRVCSHKDETVQSRAVKILSPANAGQRTEVLAAYKSALSLQGNVESGRIVFQKTCIACHKAENKGHELGPNLATFKHRGAEAILAAVIDPNREVNPLYATYSAVTADGRVLGGMITDESATSITLTREEGKSDTVLRSELEELRATGVSLMPIGLEKEIDQQAMADLLAYVMSL